MAPEDAPEPSQQTDSLLRRLAGASVTKAGLALDQSEINRIIAEASKGSKFYENEKRKDKDLTERIEKLLKHRDEVLKGVDIPKIEAHVDQMIEKMESERDLTQSIVHVDMDAFYASVELLHNPGLKDKAFGVGRGVLTTASYEARKFGVRSGMATFVAKKLCPHLIIVSNHFHLYSEMSHRVMDIFSRYDDNMCPAGTDEAYLNITQYCEEHALTVEECVSQMRQAVFDETKLTVSAGIAPNKMLAKICSDKNKPNGQFKLDFDSQTIRNFMQDLSIRKVPGIGKVNERLLESIGIQKCGHIYTNRALISLMDREFGLVFLLRTFLGIASNVVQPHLREERKSIGAERTFSPLGDEAKILAKLEEVAEELENDMEHEGWTGKTVTLKFKLDTYQVFTRAKSLGRWVTKKEDLFNIGKELLIPELPLKIRLIGLRVTKLKDLRAPETGIKRFFGQVKPNQDEGNVKKKQKLEHEFHTVEDEDPVNEDSMPGFHEHDEGLGFEVLEDEPQLDEDIPAAGPSKPKPRPPVSAPTCSPPLNSSADVKSSGIHDPLLLKSKEKARAKSADPHTSNTADNRDREMASEAQPRTPTKGSSTFLECPICQKKLETDNQGLNAHIDFCLSRGAIWDAQAETVAGTSSSAKKGTSSKAKNKDKDKRGEHSKKESKGSKFKDFWGGSKGPGNKGHAT
ncbi:DNA polymerase kappa [Ephemerocybe angulata]|uniref:DNA polymerase kappa n=1 Tax=Ephemerocybe angulata TaxID=980116 RepID=A0A8H6IA26_9AGAR|nr:DNA polymerase kappa [Tulosesus angulatus]